METGENGKNSSEPKRGKCLKNQNTRGFLVAPVSRCFGNSGITDELGSGILKTKTEERFLKFAFVGALAAITLTMFFAFSSVEPAVAQDKKEHPLIAQAVDRSTARPSGVPE